MGKVTLWFGFELMKTIFTSENIKLAFFVALSFVVIISCNRGKVGETNNVKVFETKPDTSICTYPDVFPTFKYDTCTTTGYSLARYISLNFRMPKELLDNGYCGSIMFDCIIERDGMVSNVKIYRGVGKRLDELVCKTIELMPKWTPGMKNGKVVRTRMTFPIRVIYLYDNVEE